MIKNIKVIIIALIIASPCWGQAGTIQNQIILHTQTDSLNYAMGFANGNAIKNYFFKDKPLDESIHVFLKYFDEGFTSDKQFVKPDSTTNKYAEIIEIGNKVGTSLKGQLATGLMQYAIIKVDFQLLRKGLEDGMRDIFIYMTPEISQKYLQETLVKINLNNISHDDELNKTACEEFLAKNKLREEVITTQSGLQYEVIKKGIGAFPTGSSRVKVLYLGRKIDGTIFDDRSKPDQAIVFKLSETIKGWMEGILLMQVGSKFRIYIPQELAYGIVRSGVIKPYSALIFEIELLSIEE